MINQMGMESKPILMAANMKGNFDLERSKEEGNLLGSMGPLTMVSLRMDLCKEKVFIVCQMEISMRENLERIKDMEKEG